ncbi:MAG: hypothetical protein ABH833_02815 [Parcubacteria group bacterium]
MFDIVKRYNREIVLILAIILVGFLSFNLGRIYVYSKTNGKISIESPITAPEAYFEPNIGSSEPEPEIDIPEITPIARSLKDVEVIISGKSKSGVFHYPWCPGAKQIKEENKVVFQNAEAAIAAGYHLAGNCKE